MSALQVHITIFLYGIITGALKVIFINALQVHELRLKPRCLLVHLNIFYTEGLLVHMLY